MNKELRESDWTVKDIPKNLDKLPASLQVVHKEILDKNAMRGAKATEKYEQCNVSEGDFLLWSRVDERYHPKLLITRTGPLPSQRSHTSSIKLYAEDSFEVTEEILEHVSQQRIMLKVKSIAGHKFVPDVKDFILEVLCLQKLMHECPVVVRNYVEGVNKASDGDTVHKAMERASAKN
ncbi:hypothetical protein H257_07763 [Aphanomyces astaci]|uniref:Uncharacterized protein n=1 Tax=Aphanomyces astaci TaxID=112090 RepID=W4GIX3_APHAT|nr:hypothetical protein H257_07763 [Aphanomyces astaci]ETV78979.1 hypothetical protein H257_07763 [Aphanomyces astaci]|eukprot:XP_009831698.1 hypothetical protein H257_07763 [Aphanomyces astaci]